MPRCSPQSALSRPRQDTVSVNGPLGGMPLMTAARPPMQDAVTGPSACQPVFSERMRSSLLVPVATNTGDVGVVPSGLGIAATAGAAMIFPPSACQPLPSCGASAHSRPSLPSAPTATAREEFVETWAVTVVAWASVAGATTASGLIAATRIRSSGRDRLQRSRRAWRIAVPSEEVAAPTPPTTLPPRLVHRWRSHPQGSVVPPLDARAAMQANTSSSDAGAARCLGNRSPRLSRAVEYAR